MVWFETIILPLSSKDKMPETEMWMHNDLHLCLSSQGLITICVLCSHILSLLLYYRLAFKLLCSQEWLGTPDPPASPPACWVTGVLHYAWFMQCWDGAQGTMHAKQVSANQMTFHLLCFHLHVFTFILCAHMYVYTCMFLVWSYSENVLNYIFLVSLVWSSFFLLS